MQVSWPRVHHKDIRRYMSEDIRGGKNTLTASPAINLSEAEKGKHIMAMSSEEVWADRGCTYDHKKQVI